MHLLIEEQLHGEGEKATESQRKVRAKNHEGSYEKLRRVRGKLLKGIIAASCPQGSCQLA